MANVKPWYWIIQDTIPLAQAVREYGPEVTDAENIQMGQGEGEDNLSVQPMVKHGFVMPDPHDRLMDQETVAVTTVYAEPNEFVPEGLQILAVRQTATEIYQRRLNAVIRSQGLIPGEHAVRFTRVNGKVCMVYEAPPSVPLKLEDEACGEPSPQESSVEQ